MRVKTETGNVKISLNDKQLSTIASCLAFSRMHWYLKDPEVSVDVSDIDKTFKHIMDELDIDAEHTIVFTTERPGNES